MLTKFPAGAHATAPLKEKGRELLPGPSAIVKGWYH
jgi:hypothetical protein